MREKPTEEALLDSLSETPRPTAAVASDLSVEVALVERRLSALEAEGRVLATEEGWVRRTDADTDELLDESERLIRDRLGRDPRR